MENIDPLGFLQPLPIPQTIWTDISMDCGRIAIVKGILCSNVCCGQIVKICILHGLETSLNNAFKLHEMSKNIVSDQGPIFTSKFWKNLFKLQGVNLSYFSAYHPQSDGQTEAVNKCLEQYWRCFSGDKPRYW